MARFRETSNPLPLFMKRHQYPTFCSILSATSWIVAFCAVSIVHADSRDVASCSENAKNPIIWADVPDLSMIRVEDTYYMASTTMHMNPGLPIMRSRDLVSWELVSYAYDTLVDNDKMSLENGDNAYGAGSWAPSLRHHDGVYYASTFSSTSGKTHVFTTKDIEHGQWEEFAFEPSLHDHTLWFEDDGRVFLIWGAGELGLIELNPGARGIKEGAERQVIIPNASLIAGANIGLPAEGAQLFKVNGKYYLFNIVWPRGDMRTVLVHRADSIFGPGKDEWPSRIVASLKAVSSTPPMASGMPTCFATLVRSAAFPIWCL
jgi:beta-xylosidase